VAPASTVIPGPIVMDVSLTHSHEVPEMNVTFVSTTGFPEQSGHGEAKFGGVVVSLLKDVLVTYARKPSDFAFL